MKRPTNPDGIREREFTEREGWDEELPTLREAFNIEEQHEGALATAIENAIEDGFDVTGIMIDLDKLEAPKRAKVRAKTARIEEAVRAASDLAFAADDPRRRAVEEALAVIVGHLRAAAKGLHDARNAPVKAAVEHLVRFWKETLNRPFHSDHNEWYDREKEGPLKGPDRGDRFVWDALALAGLPPERLASLSTVLRDFGKPRPRLRDSSPQKAK